MDPTPTTAPPSLLVRITRPGNRWWPWTIIGALYGLAFRLIVGYLAQSGPMSIAFILATPIVVGALTIYAGRHERQSIPAIIFRPRATIALMLIGCAITMMEGAICIAM